MAMDIDQKLDFRGFTFPGVQLKISTALQFLSDIVLCKESFVRAKILRQNTSDRNIDHAPQQPDIEKQQFEGVSFSPAP